MFFCVLNFGKESNSGSFRDEQFFSPRTWALPGRQNCPLVGRLICLSMFVSGDRQWGDKARAIIVTRCHSFLLVSALWPHTIALLFRFSLLWNCDNRNTCFCPSEQQQHLPKCHLLGDMPVILLATRFQVYIRLRYTRNKIFISCEILHKRGKKRITWNLLILLALWLWERSHFFHIWFQDKAVYLAIIG